MTEKYIPTIRELLIRLGYHEASIQDILDELIILLKEVDLHKIKRSVDSAAKKNNTAELVKILKDLMVFLENKGFYRPDIPGRLSELLVNGLNIGNENIFSVLKKARIHDEKRKKEEELLVSCATITQLGYILLNILELEVKVASAGPHVFLLIDSYSPDSMIFIDFSLDSIHEIDIQQTYNRTDNVYSLKNKEYLPEIDSSVFRLLIEYYSFFHTTTGFGLSHNIHNNLGFVYDTAGRYEEAMLQINEALRLDPGYIEAHNNLAVIYYNLARYKDAITELKEGLRLNPDDSQTLCNLGIVYARLRRSKEAVTQVQKALKLDPGNAPAHNILANIYADQKKNHEAITEYQKALTINPDFSLAHNNLGYLYFESQRHEDAVKEFEEAIRFDPNFIEAHHGIGLALYSIGKYDRSAHAWAKAVYLEPGLMDSVPEKIKLKVTLSLSRLKFS
jgi:tetratricopeptide (TPR) repeat protein